MIKIFLILQVLDLLTTLLGLKLGLVEKNPAVVMVMKLGPVAGLLLAKFLALVLLGLCVWLKRPRVIWRVNYFFAALVAWNSLLIIIRATGYA